MRRLLPLALAALVGACAGNPRGDRDHLDAMSREHARDRPVANASAQMPRQEVVAREVAYVVAGDTVTGYLARPLAAPAGTLPGVVMIHEWWGLNENIRTLARRLAGEGYTVFAVDMYHDRVARTPQEARALMQEVMNDPERGMAHLRTAAEYLRSQGAGKIGVTGWCFGGGWTLQAALGMPERVDAAVMYYGRVVTDPERLARLGAPLLGIFGAEDQGIPVEEVRQMERTLEELGKAVDVRIYDGAGHAFANPSGEAYRPDAAEDAWERTLAFFDEHLKDG